MKYIAALLALVSGQEIFAADTHYDYESNRWVTQVST
jgi:predicted secreted protein